MGKKFYIESYGCQMNLYDSELISGLLRRHNYEPTSKIDEADLILLNTCSVREHAADKIYSRLGQIRRFKNGGRNVKIGVVGCVAKHERNRILEKKNYVDFVLGPDNYRELPDLLKLKTAQVVIHAYRKEVYDDLIPDRKTGVTAYISIMRGCNNFCSFCIVPYTRGRERSRSPESILKEVKKALDDSYKEIMLLGQNVNSYRYGDVDFVSLLKEIDRLEGKFRIRFTSPHPRDVSPSLIESMAQSEKICKHIHLPLQAGSTRILKAMNRDYSRERYLNLVQEIKTAIPEIAITTDIIVGFPGETDSDFQETLEVMQEVKFDNAYMFKFSPRSGTRAATLPEQIPEEIKAQRLQKVIELQNQHTSLRYSLKVNSICEVLVEKPSRKNAQELLGRTDDNKLVVFKKGQPRVNQFVNARIYETAGVTLFGELINNQEKQ